MTTIDLDQLLDTKEATAYLGLKSVATLGSQAKKGRVDYVRKVGNSYLFTRDQLDAYRASHQRTGGKKRMRALEDIIRQLYSAIEAGGDAEPIGAYLTSNQALAEQVVATGSGEEADDGEQPAEDDEKACPECHLVFDTISQRDTHLRLRHPA